MIECECVEKQFYCSDCNITFESEDYQYNPLSEHIKFKCPLCKTLFETDEYSRKIINH